MALKLSGTVAGDRPPWSRPHLAGFSLCRHLQALKAPSSTALGDVSVADTRWEWPRSLAEMRDDTQARPRHRAPWGAVLSGGRVAECPPGRPWTGLEGACPVNSASISTAAEQKA